jgi:hypothetical protein
MWVLTDLVVYRVVVSLVKRRSQRIGKRVTRIRLETHRKLGGRKIRIGLKT